MSTRRFRSPLILLVFACAAGAASSLSDDDRNLIQDAGGWEYISLSDSQNGFPTTHTCFDGKPHPEECSGKLVLSPANRFTQTTRIRGQSISRTGHYELKDDQLTFFDEFETKDGPYTLTLDRDAKTLKMAMPQVTVDLMLEKEYRAQMKNRKNAQPR